MGDGDDLGRRVDELFQFVQPNLAGIVERDHTQIGVLLPAQHLPGDDIAVMLQAGQDDLIARMDIGSAKGLGDEIDRLGRPAREDQLTQARNADELLHLDASFLVKLRGPFAERMNAAMHVGVIVFVIVPKRLDHRPRLLRRRGIVEIDERLAVHLLMQDRKIGADAFDIERRFRHDFRFRDGDRHRFTYLTIRASSSSRSDSILSRLTISLANANVSSFRAASSGMPRDCR